MAARARCHARGRELRGATLGFIGYGGIARQMAQLARAFGMQIVACDPLLQEADIPLQPLDAVLSEGRLRRLPGPLRPPTRST